MRRRGYSAPARPAVADGPTEPEERVRDAGGPEDLETHTCECDYLFEAPVSTSVACPNCGADQAW
jgi:hypothetical protein